MLLTPATAKMAPGRVEWTEEMLDAFHHLREALCCHCVLTVPYMSDTFQLHMDASGVGVGAVLNVIREGEEHPVAFYSRQLKGLEQRYSATELKALAVVSATEHFAHFLYGTRFAVLTDHRPLTSLLSSKTLNRRLRGLALKLMEFNVVIEYREGCLNGNADALSRQSWREDEADEMYLKAEETGLIQTDEIDQTKEEIPVPDPSECSDADAHLSKGGCGNAHRKRGRKRKTPRAAKRESKEQ